MLIKDFKREYNAEARLSSADIMTESIFKMGGVRYFVEIIRKDLVGGGRFAPKDESQLKMYEALLKECFREPDYKIVSGCHEYKE